MLVPLIVAALLAVVFLALFLTTRSKAASEREAAAARQAELTTERDGLAADKAKLTEELDAAKVSNTHLTPKADTAAGEVRRLTGELDKVRATAAEQATTIETHEGRIAELEAEVVSLAAQVEVAETAAASALARSSGLVIGEVEGDGTTPETLWNLELTRSDRTWRTSVSTNPEADKSPFDDADDPARLAVEIEAAALRENVGAAIEVAWDAEPVADLAQRHLLVRVAQELLESAARSPEPSVLTADSGDDGAVVLSLTSAEEAGEPINIIPPRITSDLLAFKTDSGLTIEISADDTGNGAATAHHDTEETGTEDTDADAEAQAEAEPAAADGDGDGDGDELAAEVAEVTT
ncbi:MAG: hypothetical protein AAF962_22530 [Actinomycetota bacterium]